jgi:hypothetical protein
MATTFNRGVPKGLRIGQFHFNFLAWMKKEKEMAGEFNDGKWCMNCSMADTFYIRDEDWMRLYDEYVTYLHEQKDTSPLR